MSYPKFAVGEDVLIYSKHNLQYDGFETKVISYEYKTWTNRSTREDFTGYGYRISPDPSGMEGGWFASSLRKRPSNFTFKELMESLKMPVPA